MVGEVPDWYPLIQAARYLQVPPWELAKQTSLWKYVAIAAMNAEAHAAEMKRKS